MLTAFIVEDEPLLCEMVAEFVREAGRVNIVGKSRDGGEAIDSILKLIPDVVITDLILPNADGFDVLSQVRARYPHIKFLIFTGSTTADRVRRAVELEADAFIEKTSGITEFEAALEAICNDKRYYSPGVLDVVRRLNTDKNQ